MAQQDDATTNPATPSDAYQDMAPKWEMIETLLGGTASMRAAGEEYLPRHSAEEQHDYDERLNTAVLYNVLELTLDSLVGRVFREEARLNDDVPDKIKNLSSNIDLQRTPLSSFLSMWFREGIAKGFAHVYIDMPALSADQRATRTLADDQKENRRPFWSLIKPENLIFAFFENINGVDTLTHARFVESRSELVGFAEQCHTQIRVLTPGAWEVWEDENELKKGRKPKWVVVSEGTFDLPIIPLVTFYANKSGNMVCKPPLEDLAYMNVRHWQSNSDQINVLTVARFPMLASSGAQVEAGKHSQPIGPRQLLTMRDPNGRFYYVEHSGKAIAAGKDDLESLEERMAAYGAEFLRRKITGRTAFERAADSNEAISPLKRMAIEFGQTVEHALEITGMWMNIPQGETGTITVNTEFTEIDESPAPLNTLEKARERLDLSRETWLNEMVRRGVLDQTLNVKDELARIVKEAKTDPLPGPAVRWMGQIRDTINTPGSPQEIAHGTAPGDKAAAAGQPPAPPAGTPPAKGGQQQTKQ